MRDMLQINSFLQRFFLYTLPGHAARGWCAVLHTRLATFRVFYRAAGAVSCAG